VANVNPSLRETIDGFLKNKLLSVQRWLMVMLQMSEFAAALHAQGKSLSTMIKNCLTIDNRDKRQPIAVFYYCQPFEALQHQYCRCTDKEKEKLREYVPDIEITTDNPQPAMVDVWIMGKEFERIANGWYVDSGG
jgi:hypothetical protein